MWSGAVCDSCGTDIPYPGLGLRSMGGAWPVGDDIIIDTSGHKAHGFIVRLIQQISSLVDTPYTGLGLSWMSSWGGKVWPAGGERIGDADVQCEEHAMHWPFKTTGALFLCRMRRHITMVTKTITRSNSPPATPHPKGASNASDVPANK